MLTTEINTIFKAGSGGNGKLSFYATRKGPDGGNGGCGGSIYIAPTTDIYALAVLSKSTIIKAESGQYGMSNKKHGRNGKNLFVQIPIGTIITDKDSKEVFEINKNDQQFLICKGGAGGRGNWEFRSSRNTTPRYFEKGKEGQSRNLHINLKLIADFGLIGLPNAGKSSLLKELTSAKPKIGDYPFTTLEPNLGELDAKILADIPGLIEGASKGKGLGIKFLKHIERVSLLFHCLSCESNNLIKDYRIVRHELEIYNPKLLEIPETILLTKTDLLSKAELKSWLVKLKRLKKPVLPISIYDPDSFEKLQMKLKSSLVLV